MLIHQLTDQQCRELLGRTHLARLACARDNQPHIVPIYFSYDAEANCLYSFSTVGRKIEWMRKNPKVCLELDEIVDQAHWTTVLVTGRYQELRSVQQDAPARARAQALFEQRAEWWLPAAAPLATGEERDRGVFYRIQIDRVSGRRAARPA